MTTGNETTRKPTTDPMTEADLPVVLGLAAQLGYPGNTIGSFAERFAEIQKSPDHALFVARNELGKTIGFIQIHREPHTLLSGPRADVGALVVDQQERGQGVGAALLRRAESWAREKRLPLIRIRSNVKREKAHQFYRRNGYAIAKSWHLLTKTIG